MSEEITYEQVKAAVTTPDPGMEAIAILLKEVARDSVSALAGVFLLLGQSPKDVPGAYLLQSMLVESEEVFGHITREQWVGIYDGYVQIKAIIDANPGLRDEASINKSRTEKTEVPESSVPSVSELERLLNGEF